MPKIATELSYLDIKNMDKCGTFAIGYVSGLSIRISSVGARKTYVFRYKFDNKESYIKIGNFHHIDIKTAIDDAYKYQDCLDKGLDPKILQKVNHARFRTDILSMEQSLHGQELYFSNRSNRNPQYQLDQVRSIARNADNDVVKAKTKESNSNNCKIITIEAAVYQYLDYLEAMQAFENNRRGYSERRGMVKNHIFNKINPSTILSSIEATDFNNCISAIWSKHASLSSKLYNFIINFIDWATANNYYDDLMFKSHLKTLMAPYRKRKASSGHNPCLDFKQIPYFVKVLWENGSISAMCFIFSILTAARSQAVRMLTWKQLDLDNCLWHIPLENDKSKVKDRIRTIILSPQAVALAKHINKSFFADSADSDSFVFKQKTNKNCLSDNAFRSLILNLNKTQTGKGLEPFVDKNCLDEAGRPRVITQHGTARSTFKTWSKSDELGNLSKFNQEAVEICLLHSRNDPLRGAYDRSTLVMERNKVMSAWGKYCCSLIPEFKFV